MALAKKKANARTTADKMRSPAHNLDSAKFNLSHAIRHIETGGDTFNRQHAKHHAENAMKDIKSLTKSAAKVPAVKKELGKLNSKRSQSVSKGGSRNAR